MITRVFITGTGTGIGRALAQRFLKEENTFVTGISRSNTLHHERFNHLALDLSDATALSDFSFNPEPADRFILVNNAGTIGDIGHVGSISGESLHTLNTLNISAPMMLTNTFLSETRKVKGEAIILNVSSGAGKSAIASWAGYCGSKAALDLFSMTVADELIEAGRNARIFSVAPGVVDTPMQGVIRDSSSGAFSRVDNFKALKSEGGLATPESVAEHYFTITTSPSDFPSTVFSVRDL